MKNKFLTAIVLLVCLLLALLIGCNLTAFRTADTEKIIVGVTAGPHAEIMEVVKKVAEKNGLKIIIVEFNDYIKPNTALNEGTIDLNSFQHQPYLDRMIKDRKYDIMPIAKTVLFPIGLYSKKVNSLADIATNSVILIPHDPINGGRALKLLAKAGLITLRPLIGYDATKADIISNPKELVIQEVDAARISYSLDNVNLVVMNSNYAAMAGFIPIKDALLLEASDSSYTSVLAVRTNEKDNPAVQKLITAYHSEEVKQFVNEHFKGTMLAAW